MRRLLLMRHGEAAAAHLTSNDHQRELTEAGWRSATRTGQQLLVKNYVPELVLCSDAKRTLMTWEAMKNLEGLKGRKQQLDAGLYLADAESLVLRCCEVADKVTTLLLIGHNPGCSELASTLGRKIVNLDVAHLAVLEFPDSGAWAEVLYEEQKWSLVSILR